MSPTDLVWTSGPAFHGEPTLPAQYAQNTFRGLSISSTPNSALLDGNVGSTWFYAVGTRAAFGYFIPSEHVGVNNEQQHNSAQRASLYVRGGTVSQ